jgi:hypothetical protein
METSFRSLDADEMALLEKLLDHDFPGRDALRRQLPSVRGRQIDEHGCLELQYNGDTLADTTVGCPTEGTCADVDGGVIAVLLHVKKGRMRLLEIVKEDGSEILRPPTGKDLRVY